MWVRFIKRTGYTEQEPVTMSYTNYTEYDVIVRDMVGFTHRVAPDRDVYEPTAIKGHKEFSLEGAVAPKRGEFRITKRYNLSDLPRDERAYFIWDLVNGEALSAELRAEVARRQSDLSSGSYDLVIYFIVDSKILDTNRRVTLSDTGLMVSRDHDDRDDYHPHPFSDRGIVEYFNGNVSNISGNGLTFKLVYAKSTKDPKILFYRFLGQLYRLEGEQNTGLSDGVHLLIKKAEDNSTDCLGGDNGFDMQFAESELTSENGFFRTLEEANSTIANPEIVIQDLRQQLKIAKAKSSDDIERSSKALEEAKLKHAQALDVARKQAEAIKAELELKDRVIDVERDNNARLKEDLNSAKRREEEFQNEINRLRADNEKTHNRFKDYVDDVQKENRRAEQEKREAKKGFMDSFGNILKIFVGVITAIGGIMSIHNGMKLARVA